MADDAHVHCKGAERERGHEGLDGSGIADTVLTSFVNPQLALHFDWVERELGRSPWFAGDEITVETLVSNPGDPMFFI